MPPRTRTSAAQVAAETAAGIDPFATPTGPAGRTDAVRRDGYGRYMAPLPPSDEHPTGGPKDRPYTRATTLAKTVADTFAINQWGKRMVAKGLTLRPDLRALVAATPLDDRDTLNKACADAEAAAGAKVSANLGTARHALTELMDRGQPLPPLEPEEERDLAAYRKVLADEGIEVLSDWIERTVVLPEYDVAGTLDRIVRMPDGSLRIADLKTGADLSYGWGEICIQLRIYAAAQWAYDYKATDPEKAWLAMPKVDQNIGLVIHLPVGKGEAMTYDVNLKAGQEGLDLAFKTKEWRKKKNLAVPRQKAVAGLPAAEGTPVAVAPATPMERVLAATNKATLAALWDELTGSGARPEAWTAELQAAAASQLSKWATT